MKSTRTENSQPEAHFTARRRRTNIVPFSRGTEAMPTPNSRRVRVNEETALMLGDLNELPSWVQTRVMNLVSFLRKNGGETSSKGA
jgi:hypothetical protein